MRRSLTAAALLALTTSSVAAAPPTQPYDFKGIRLETTLDAFRRLPHPDNSPGRIICTGDKMDNVRTNAERQVEVSNPDEKALGVIKCIWVAEISPGTGDMIAGLGLAGSGYWSYDYTFNFMKDPVDGIVRLYAFRCTTDVKASDDVVEALTRKWGAPQVTKGTANTLGGASLEKSIYLWDNKSSNILVETRFSKIDDLAIIAVSTKYGKILNEETSKRKRNTKNGI